MGNAQAKTKDEKDEESLLEVQVIQADGTTSSLCVPESTTVDALKQKIEQEHGEDARSFELFCSSAGESELKNKDILSKVKADSGDTPLCLYMISGGEESINQKIMCNGWGFPPSHLQLLEEYYSKSECA